MDRYAGHKSAGAQLYPTIDPFDQQILHVDGGHQIYFEQCGCSEGIPVVVLHGGPGGGCSPSMRRYFDPKFTGLSYLINAVVGDRGPTRVWKIILLQI